MSAEVDHAVARPTAAVQVALAIHGSTRITACRVVNGPPSTVTMRSFITSFPGLPQSIDFVLFPPRAAWTARGLLAIAGVAAGAWPAWRGASLPIARVLREEAA